MQTISEFLAGLTLAAPQAHGGLTAFPLIAAAGNSTAPEYTLLADAPRCEVDELSGEGRVGELVVTNRSERQVLMLDGEEVVGGKQNRILNLSVLVPAHATIVVPVSCVEAGRWHASGRGCRPSDRAMFAAARAQTAADVSRAMREGRGRQTDQGRVWDAIAARAAAAAPFRDEAADRIGPLPQQVGAVFASGEAVLGLDLFDHPATLRAWLPRLVRSYGLAARQRDGAAPLSRAAVESFLAAVATAPTRRYAAAGLGEDLRFTDGVEGGCLVYRGRAIHVCAFPGAC